MLLDDDSSDESAQGPQLRVRSRVWSDLSPAEEDVGGGAAVLPAEVVDPALDTQRVVPDVEIVVLDERVLRGVDVDKITVLLRTVDLSETKKVVHRRNKSTHT